MPARIRALGAAAAACALVWACTPGGGCSCSAGSGGDGGGRPDGGGGNVVWSAACTGLDDYVLGVWGPGPDELFFVGGNTVTSSALLLHYDGTTWLRTTGVSTEMLWWVWGISGQDVWAVGKDGEALHFKGGTWDHTATGTAATLYGVWGSSADAVWAVGGAADPMGARDVFLLWNGTVWGAVPADVPSGEIINKVWGTSSSDVWAVGTGGVIFHYTGGIWMRAPSPTTEPLVSLWGAAPDDIWAVGGADSGVLLHYDGAAWALVGSGFSPGGLNGVWTGPGSSAMLVGNDGFAGRFRDGAPELLLTGVDQDLVSVFIDGSTTWAVGGNLSGGAGAGGVILRFGLPAAPCEIVEFMQPPIVEGTDGGVADPCPGGTATVAAGGECGSGRDCQCMAGLECWYIVIQSSQINNHFICTAPCANDAACTGMYGSGACCIIPGPQTVTTVCHPPGWTPAAGDPCN